MAGLGKKKQVPVVTAGVGRSINITSKGYTAELFRDENGIVVVRGMGRPVPNTLSKWLNDNLARLIKEFKI